MQRWLGLTIILFAVWNFPNCSGIKFGSDPSFARCQNFNQPCVTKDGRDFFDYEITIANEKVDIIFIDDNSNSMRIEQQHMGSKFPNFLDGLEDLNYRIGIITTDISTNGQLLTFPNGQNFISNSTPGKEDQFLQTIQRSEIGSNDERGIYNANLCIVRNADGMIRTDSEHVAFVVLSDEDERSSRAVYTNTSYPQYALQELDQPATLIQNAREKWPGKTFSFHAIIVRPGDGACVTAQAQQISGAKGFEGFKYAEAHQMTNDVSRFPLGNICAADYGAQLRNIGSGIKTRALNSPLPCIPDDLQITFTPQSSAVSWTVNTTTREIEFANQIPTGTSVRHQFSCPSL